MKLSEFIEDLEEYKKEHGDIDIELGSFDEEIIFGDSNVYNEIVINSLSYNRDRNSVIIDVDA